VRTDRARKIRAANRPSGASLLLMLDTDLVLQPEVIAWSAQAREIEVSDFFAIVLVCVY
jgi:hypothetical protein